MPQGTAPTGKRVSVATLLLTLTFATSASVYDNVSDARRAAWALMLAVTSLALAHLLARAQKPGYGSAAWLAAFCSATLAQGAAAHVMTVVSVLLLLLGAVCFDFDLLGQRELLVTDLDVRRLHAIAATLDEAQRPALEALRAELARAIVVPSTHVPNDVVTMNSRIVFRDLESGLLREATLVYPEDADATANRISILAPLGRALIGLRVGECVFWRQANGPVRGCHVAQLAYQPEAAGHFHL